jgi:hypothetical protein
MLYVIRDLGVQGINPWPPYGMLLWAGALGRNLTIAGAPALSWRRDRRTRKTDARAL